jgi:hypothetical protein
VKCNVSFYNNQIKMVKKLTFWMPQSTECNQNNKTGFDVTFIDLIALVYERINWTSKHKISLNIWSIQESETD